MCIHSVQRNEYTGTLTKNYLHVQKHDRKRSMVKNLKNVYKHKRLQQKIYTITIKQTYKATILLLWEKHRIIYNELKIPDETKNNLHDYSLLQENTVFYSVLLNRLHQN